MLNFLDLVSWSLSREFTLGIIGDCFFCSRRLECLCIGTRNRSNSQYPISSAAPIHCIFRPKMNTLRFCEHLFWPLNTHLVTSEHFSGFSGMTVHDPGIGVHVKPGILFQRIVFQTAQKPRAPRFLGGAMSGKRITMRKIRDILQIDTQGNLSIRQIRASTKVSVDAVQNAPRSGQETLQLGWPLDPALTDNQPARLFYPEADTRASRLSRA